MQETKHAERSEPVDESGRRGDRRGRRRPPRAMMLMMPVMMLAVLCLHVSLWRRLKRVERTAGDAERRSAEQGAVGGA